MRYIGEMVKWYTRRYDKPANVEIGISTGRLNGKAIGLQNDRALDRRHGKIGKPGRRTKSANMVKWRTDRPAK